eukprot:3756474-Prorocentrum_lima.AAC.1
MLRARRVRWHVKPVRSIKSTTLSAFALALQRRARSAYKTKLARPEKRRKQYGQMYSASKY